jgi:hypothetical protein
MAIMWTLLNPVGSPERGSSEAIAVGTSASRATTIGFLSNKKPNTVVLERALGARVLAESFGVGVHFYEKLNSASPADPALLDQIASECAFAINGVGD